jgi:hypothetical protein
VIDRFQSEGRTVTQADLLDLRTKVQDLVNAIGTPAEWLIETRFWTLTGEEWRPVTEPKPHALMAPVEAIRAEFT